MASWENDQIIQPAGSAPKAGKPWEADPIVGQPDGAGKPLGEFGQSHVGQGISGVNEGIANMLGAPAQLANDWLVAPAMAGINAVAGTDLKPSQKPFLGTKMMQDIFSPTIAPATSDPVKQGIRRVGNEIGAMAIPGGGVVAKAAKPMQVIGAELASALGSGAGAVTANTLFPGNATAEMIGSLAGGFSPMTVSSALRRSTAKAAAPTAEALQQAKEAAYKYADGLGVKYTPTGYQGLFADVSAAVKADNISPTRHPKSFSFVQDMQQRGQNGLTLTELDQLRQEVRRDLLRSADESERHFGGVILDEIDSYIAKAGGPQIAAGSGVDANEAILAARELNTRWRKTELIEDALYAAELKAASAGSGGNLNNNIRTALRGILLNPKKRAAYTADEISEMEGVVKQGKAEDLLRLVGKLSPQGNGLMLALGIGGTAINPGMAGVSVAGALAKNMADNGTINKAANLRASVARGGSAQLPPFYSQDQGAVAKALLAGQAANQNQPNAVSQALLRPHLLN